MWYRLAKITVSEYYNQLNKIKSNIKDETLKKYFEEKIIEIDILPDKISDNIAKYIIRNNINILANLNYIAGEENKDRIDPNVFNNSSIESKKQYLDKIINDYKNKLINLLDKHQTEFKDKTINISDIYQHKTEIMNLCERLKQNPLIFNKYCSNIMTGQILINPLKLFDEVFTPDKINSININNIDQMYNEAVLKYNQELMQQFNYNISKLLYYDDLNNIVYTFTEAPYENWTIRRISLGNHILEGHKMNHCVGKNHTRYIGNMKYFYYSLRNENNWPIVTFHVDENGKIEEMKAANNSNVPENYNNLLQQFFKTEEWQNEINSFSEKKQILNNMYYDDIDSVEEFNQFINDIEKYSKDNVLYTSLLYQAIKNMSSETLIDVVDELLQNKFATRNTIILIVLVSRLVQDIEHNADIIMDILKEWNILLDNNTLKELVLNYDIFTLLVDKKYNLDENIIKYLMNNNCYDHLLYLLKVDRKYSKNIIQYFMEKNCYNYLLYLAETDIQHQSLDYYNLQLICKNILEYMEDINKDDKSVEENEYEDYNYDHNIDVYTYQFFKLFFNTYYTNNPNVEYVAPILINSQMFNDFKHLLTPDRLKKLTVEDINIILKHIENEQLLEQIFKEYAPFILKNYDAFMTLLNLVKKDQNFAPLLIENYKKCWNRLSENENSEFIVNVFINNKKSLLQPILDYCFNVLNKKVNAKHLQILSYKIYDFIQQYEKHIDNIGDTVFTLLLRGCIFYINDQHIQFIKQLYHKYKHNINVFPIAEAANGDIIDVFEDIIQDHLQYKGKYSADDIKSLLTRIENYRMKDNYYSIIEFIKFLEKYQDYMEINNEVVLMILEKCSTFGCYILTEDLFTQILQIFDKFIDKDKKFEEKLERIFNNEVIKSKKHKLI